jgi:hypothetical protein
MMAVIGFGGWASAAEAGPGVAETAQAWCLGRTRPAIADDNQADCLVGDTVSRHCQKIVVQTRRSRPCN